MAEKASIQEPLQPGPGMEVTKSVTSGSGSRPKRGRPSRPTSEKLLQAVVTARAAGQSVSVIARRCQVSERPVWRILNRVKATGVDLGADENWRGRLAEKSLRAVERLLDSNAPRDFGPAGRAGIRVLEGLGQLETGKLAEVSKSTTTEVSQSSILHINPQFAGVSDEELNDMLWDEAKKLYAEHGICGGGAARSDGRQDHSKPPELLEGNTDVHHGDDGHTKPGAEAAGSGQDSHE